MPINNITKITLFLLSSLLVTESYGIDRFPDDTPVSSWFSDTTVVDIGSLGKNM